MELQSIGVRILATGICLSILLVATAEAALNVTISVSHYDHGTTSVPAANHRKTAIGGKTKWSAPKIKLPEQFTPEFNWEQQQYLKAHNDLRAKNGIPPLKWDSGLAAYARSWAMERRKDCKYRNHSNGRYGENSFWMQYKDFKPTDVVQNWFSEKQLFDHTRNLCKCKIENEECECGHYLNVIGRTTMKVGCSGYVYCSDQKGVIVYCSYDPPANYYPARRLNP